MNTVARVSLHLAGAIGGLVAFAVLVVYVGRMLYAAVIDLLDSL